jgi:hypothetical protein
MREPWKKHGGWPYEGRRGKTWQLGYRDHEGRVRSKSFKTKTAAETWAKDYVDAERRNRLREFLLGSDAPEVQPDTTPIGELILEWLATDAHPDSTGGLARNSCDTYRSIASRHIIGNPVEQLMKRWVQGMRAAGVSRSTEAKAWTVISSALSWAVEDDSWPLSMNGCLTMQRRRGMRRASRRAGTGATRQVSPGKR